MLSESIFFCIGAIHFTNGHGQYVKQETIETTESGKVARATRVISERASNRIGKMAFELALNRPRKARTHPSLPLLI